MSVAYYSEAPNATREQVDQVSRFINERLGPGVPPEGALFHANGPLEHGGWWSFDLFESDEHFDRFHDAYLVPAIAQADLPPAVYRRLEVAWDSLQVENTDDA